MKKSILWAILALILPVTQAWGHSTDHYGRAQPLLGSGSGTVYVSTDKSATSGNETGDWNCGKDGNKDANPYYFFAVPTSGYGFIGWSKESGGSTESTDNPYKPNENATGSSSERSVVKRYANFGEVISYYAALRARVADALPGAGLVYAGVNNTAPAETDYVAESLSGTQKIDSARGSGSANFYAFAKPNIGYVFDKWTEATGATISSDNPLTRSVETSNEDSKNPEVGVVVANFLKSKTYWAQLDVSVDSTVTEGLLVGSSKTSSTSEYGRLSSVKEYIGTTAASGSITFYAIAQVDPSYDFDGWFDENGTCVSSSTSYKVTINTSAEDQDAPLVKSLTAKAHHAKVVAVDFDVAAGGGYTASFDSESLGALSASIRKEGLRTVSVSMSAPVCDGKQFFAWYAIDASNQKTYLGYAEKVTASFTDSVTVGAEFVEASMAATASSLVEVRESVADSSVKVINIPGSSRFEVPVDEILTIPAGKKIVVDGKLLLLGELNVLGAVTGTGKVVKVAKQISQGKVRIPQNVYKAYTNYAYQVTTVTGLVAKISGGEPSCSVGWGVKLETNDTVYEVGCQPEVIKCYVDRSIARNHIRSVCGAMTTFDESPNDCYDKGVDDQGNPKFMVVLTKDDKFDNADTWGWKNSGYLSFQGAVDCAGYSLGTDLEPRSNFRLVVYNCKKFTPGTCTNIFVWYINCENIEVTNQNGKYCAGQQYLYDCGPKVKYSFTFSADSKFVHIYSGTYTSYQFNGAVQVYGGTYSEDPSGYLQSKAYAAGTATDEEIMNSVATAGQYVVRPAEIKEYVAQVGTEKYKTLQAALEAAASGQTIELISPCVNESEFVIPAGKTITLDLCGYGISGSRIVNNGMLSLIDTSDYAEKGTVSGDIVNNATMEIASGKYVGSVQTVAGRLTIHYGIFTANPVKTEGELVIRGGLFSNSVAALLGDGYHETRAVNTDDNVSYYWVGEDLEMRLTETSLNGTEKAYTIKPLKSDADAELAKGYFDGTKRECASYGTLADWMRMLELVSALQPHRSRIIECTLSFDRAVASGSVTAVGSMKGMSQSMSVGGLQAEELYCVLSKNISAGYSQIAFSRMLDGEFSNIACGVRDINDANVGTTCTISFCLGDGERDHRDSVTGAWVYRYTYHPISSCRVVLGANKNIAMIRPANGKATFYATPDAALSVADQNGTVMLTADYAQDVTIDKAGTYTLDPNGFAFTGAVVAGSGFKVVAEGNTYTVESAGVTITVPDVANMTKIVKVGSETIGTEGTSFTVPQNAVVTVEYTPVDGYAGAFTATLNTVETTTLDVSGKVATLVSYVISYGLDDGVNDAANPAEYTKESADIKLKAPAKNGYDFGGWFTDEALETAAGEVAITKGSMGDKKFYAKWTATAYAIDYTLNGGAAVAANPTSYTIESNDIALVASTRTGYGFDGWYTEAGFENKVGDVAIKKGSTGAKAFFAKWVATAFAITYMNLEGATFENPKADYTIEDAITLAEPAKANWTFDGWYAEAGFQNKVTGIDAGSTGDKTFYAKWSPTMVTITVPDVDNMTKVVKVGDTVLTAESGDKYSVQQGSVVTVTYTVQDAASYVGNTITKTITSASNDSSVAFADNEKPQRIVARIGTTPYVTLVDAIEAMKAGDEIIVVAESVLTVGGHEMTVTDGKLTVALYENGLEFKDGTDATVTWPTAEAATNVLVVTGGKYTSDPTAFLAQGLEAKQKDTKWVVGVKVVIAVDDTKPEAEQNVETIVTTDDQTSKVDEQKVSEIIEQAIPKTVNETEEEKQAKKDLVQELVQNINTNTKVEGVKLTTVDEKVVDEQTQVEEVVKTNGVKAVVLAAKAAAQETVQEAKDKADGDKTSAEKTAEAFKAAIEQTEKDSEITVKVEVQAKLVDYKPPVAETAEEKTGSIEFELKPEATVTVTVKDEAPVTQKVEVSNDMIDQTQKIKVSMYAGFRPVQVLHRDDDGMLIEEFTGDAIGYDEQMKIVTVMISHFSTMVLKQAAVDPLAPAGAYQIADGFYQDTEKYSTATNFYITNLNGLKYFRDLVNANDAVLTSYLDGGFITSKEAFYTQGGQPFKGKAVHLLTDVDLANEAWTPIGNQYDFVTATEIVGKPYFFGTFDGMGHTVSNLKISNTTYNASKADGAGLFGRVSSGVVFRNLTISNVVLEVTRYAGALIGNAGNSTPATAIDNCHVTGSIAISGNRFVGGLFGHGLVDVTDCSVIAVGEKGTIAGSVWHVGGFAGTMRDGSSIASCEVRHIAVSAGYSDPVVGGLIGCLHGSISNCTVADVTYVGTAATTASAGCIAGWIEGANARTLENTPKTAGQIGTYANDSAIVGWDIVGTLTVGGVKGGTFESLPVSYVASGYAKFAQGTTPETWKVLPAAASITVDATTTNLYSTLQSAIDAVQEGQTVTVLADNDETITVTNTCAFTLDANGHTLSATVPVVPAGWEFVKNGQVCTYQKCYTYEDGVLKYGNVALTEDEVAAFAGVNVQGVKGFDNKVFATIQEAYAALSDVVVSAVAKEVPPYPNDDTINATFSDVTADKKINLAWNVWGAQTLPTGYVLSCGREQGFFGSYWMDRISVDGKNAAAKVKASTITVPWSYQYSETNPLENVTLTVSNLTLEDSDANGLAIARNGIGLGGTFTFTLTNCTVNGGINMAGSYQGNSVWNVTDNTFICREGGYTTYPFFLNGVPADHLADRNTVLNFTGNTVSGYVRALNFNAADGTLVVTNNTITPGAGYSAVQVSNCGTAEISGNTIHLNGGNVLTLHENLYGRTATINVHDNVIDGTGYAVYDDVNAESKTYGPDGANVTLTWTDNSVATGASMDTKKGIKSTSEKSLSSYVYGVLNPVAKIGSQTYKTLAAAIADAANDKTRSESNRVTIDIIGECESVSTSADLQYVTFKGHEGGSMNGFQAATNCKLKGAHFEDIVFAPTTGFQIQACNDTDDSDVVISGCTFNGNHTSTKPAIQIQRYETTVVSGLKILNNTFAGYDNGSVSAVTVNLGVNPKVSYDNNVVVSGNRFKDIGFNAVQILKVDGLVLDGNAVTNAQSWAVLNVSNSTNVEIDNNKVQLIQTPKYPSYPTQALIGNARGHITIGSGNVIGTVGGEALTDPVAIIQNDQASGIDPYYNDQVVFITDTTVKNAQGKITGGVIMASAANVNSRMADGLDVNFLTNATISGLIYVKDVANKVVDLAAENVSGTIVVPADRTFTVKGDVTFTAGAKIYLPLIQDSTEFTAWKTANVPQGQENNVTVYGITAKITVGETVTKYYTLQEAIDAVKADQTVVVLADNDETITVTNTFAFTLDANGHTLSATVPVVPAGWEFVKNGDVCTYQARSNDWIEYAAESYATPVDEVNKVVTIASAAELGLFAKQVNAGASYAGYTVTLAADIDLGARQWIAAGIYDGKPFAGTFDGNEKTISNLNFNDSSKGSVGLFGYMTGVVKDVTITNVDLVAGQSVGAAVAINYGLVTNVSVCGTIKIDAQKYAGVIEGRAYGAVVDCTVDGGNKAASFVKVAEKSVGGIVGYLAEASGGYEVNRPYVANSSVANLTVSAGGSEPCAAGIAGRLQYGDYLYGCALSNVDVKGGADVATGGKTLGVFGGEELSNKTQDNNVGTYGLIHVLNCTATDVALMTADGTAAIAEQEYGSKANANREIIVGVNVAGSIEGHLPSWDFTAGTFRLDGASAEKFAAEIAEGYEAKANGIEPETWTVQEIDPRTKGYKDAQGKYTELPTAPDMTGDVINVTAANAQYVLDGAYGSIDGKTINFTESISDILVIGRPTKYVGSNTRYFPKNFTENEFADALESAAYFKTFHPGEVPHYIRTVTNVTFTAADNVVLSGFEAICSYDQNGPTYNYVHDTLVSAGDAYNFVGTFKDLVFEGLTFARTDGKTILELNRKFEFPQDVSKVAEIDGVTVRGCSFTTGATTGSVAIHFYSEGNDGSIHGLVIDDCAFNTCYQGVIAHHASDITVIDSEFDKTGHNAIQITDASTCNYGEVVITNNEFANIGDRVIRFNNVGADTQITIANNVAKDSGDSDGQVMKATSLANGITYDIHDNNWGDGKIVYNPELRDVVPVAQVVETGAKYETISAAFKYADGKTVKVLVDTDEGGIKAASGKSVTLDLNGKSLTSADANGAINQWSDATLTLTGATGGSVTKIRLASGGATVIADEAFAGKVDAVEFVSGLGTLTVKGGYWKESLRSTLNSRLADGYAFGESDVEGYLKVVAVTAENAWASVTTGSGTYYFMDMAQAVAKWQEADGSKLTLLKDVTLNGGHNIKAEGKTLTLDLNGKTWKLNDGATAQQNCLILNSGSLVIEGTDGGTMCCDEPCRLIQPSAGTSITLNGGSLVCGAGDAKAIAGINGTPAFDLTVNGGTLSSVACGGTFVAKGGTFGFDPSANVAKGYEAVAQGTDPETWRVEVQKVAQVVETGAKFESLAAALTAAASGQTVTLLANCTASSVISGKAITLDLNGKVVTQDTSVYPYELQVAAGASLTLNDTSVGVTHKFAVDGTTGLWTLDEANGTETVEGGVITGFTGSDGTVDAMGALIMNAGNIVGNTATVRCGGVKVGGTSSTGGSFTMNGGTIQGNVGGNNGGGVFVYGGNAFTLAGGTIAANRAKSAGGVENGGTFVMTGGVIEDNAVTGDGGGVSNSGTFELTAGTISDNVAQGGTARGAGVWNAGTFTLGGDAVIEGGVAKTGGAVGNVGAFTMAGGVIRNCSAESAGGVYNAVSAADMGFILVGGVISNCVANGTSAYGGAVQNGGLMTMTGGLIADCRATGTQGCGSAIWTSQSQGLDLLTVVGGVISNCVAEGSVEHKDGGAIFVRNSRLVMTGGTVVGCAGKHGSGLYVRDDGTAGISLSGSTLIDGEVYVEGFRTDSVICAGSYGSVTAAPAGFLTGGQYAVSPNAANVAAGYVVVDSSDPVYRYSIGVKVDVGGDSKATALEVESKSSVDKTQKPEAPGLTEEQKTELVDTVAKHTEVVGVKLTTEAETNKAGFVIAPSGIQAVIDAAKTNSAAFAAALAESTLVTVKVDVVVKTLEFVPSVGESSGKIKFNLEPQATVSVNGSDVAPQTVPVSNDMLDKSHDIVVKIFTGFAPAQAIHMKGDQVIETFSADEMIYDPATSNVTLTISHFSDLIFDEQKRVARVDGVDYTSLAEAIEAADGKTVSLLENVALDAAVTNGTGKTVTIDFAGKKLSWSGSATDEEKAKGLVVNDGTLALVDGSDAGNGGLDAGDGLLTTSGASAVRTTITGGCYDGTFPATGEVLVSGGSFRPNVPAANCAPGFTPGTAVGPDGRYVVSEIPATINSVTTSARDPWNGLVDVFVRLVSKNDATIVLDNGGAPILPAAVQRMTAGGALEDFNGEIAGSDAEQTLHLVWNSAAAVPVAGSVTLGVTATTVKTGRVTEKTAEVLALDNTSPRIVGSLVTNVTVSLPATWGVSCEATVKLDGTTLDAVVAGVSNYVWDTTSVLPGDHTLRLEWNGNAYEQAYVVQGLTRERWSALTIDNMRTPLKAKDIEVLPMPAGWDETSDGPITMTVLKGETELESQQALSASEQWVLDTRPLVPGTYTVRMTYTVGGVAKTETVTYEIEQLTRARWSALTIDNTRAKLPAKDLEALPLPAKWGEAATGKILVEVLDAGKNVLDSKLVDPGDTDWVFDSSTLKPGEYTVRMSYATATGNSVETVKYDLVKHAYGEWSSMTVDNTRQTLPAKDLEALPLPAKWGEAATGKILVEVLAGENVIDSKLVDPGDTNWVFDSSTLKPGEYTVRMSYSTATGNSVETVKYGLKVLCEQDWESLTVDNRNQTIKAGDEQDLPMPAKWGEIADDKVKLELLDENLNVIDTAWADRNDAKWTFNTRPLMPGVYTVRMTYTVNGAGKESTATYLVDVLVEAESNTLTIDNRLKEIAAKDNEKLALPASWGESPEWVKLTLRDADGNVVSTVYPDASQKTFDWSTVPVLPGRYTVTIDWPNAQGDTNAVYNIAMFEQGVVDLGRIDNQVGVRDLATSSPVFQLKWPGATNAVLTLDGVNQYALADANGLWTWNTNGLGYGIYTFTNVVDGVVHEAKFRVEGEIIVDLEEGKLPVEKAWYTNHVGQIPADATAKSLDAKLKESTLNGAPYWQNYVLGWNPTNANERILIRLTGYNKAANELSALLEGKKGDRTEFGNLQLKYILRTGTNTTGAAWTTSLPQSTNTFVTPFTPADGQKYYKGTIILTPKE